MVNKKLIEQFLEINDINFTLKIEDSFKNIWILWFIDGRKIRINTQNWSQNLKEIVSIEYIEEFVNIYNDIIKIDISDFYEDYYLFKKYIRPDCKNEININGGKISIQFPRNKYKKNINKYWLLLMLYIINNNFSHENEICGIGISGRKIFFRISLWIKTEEIEIVETIIRELKEFLNLPVDIKLNFKPNINRIEKIN